MLKMSLTDRDEHNKKRIPILMNYLKLRITDSAHSLSQQHAVFRIELEYGDGLLKWVVYREMADFWNLHGRYKVANLRHEIPNLPAFPKIGLPYWNLLKEEREKHMQEMGMGGKEISKEKFNRIQRERLENYLLKLIRAVMFRPEANRLCKFLEISALSIQLATAGAGAFQGKQGYLSLHVSGGSGSGISRKGLKGFHPMHFKKKHEPKWFLVRESYIVCVDEPDDPTIYDVILIDSDFVIERPKRLYKQGLHLLQHHKDEKTTPFTEDLKSDTATTSTSPVATGKPGDSATFNGAEDPADPSTTNSAPAKKKAVRDASSHTFYVKNSERRLRLVAKNERQMDQFVASIEMMAKRSIWAGKNRFDSFAPIRMNVEAQWLVDGRDYFWNLSKAILMAKESIYIHDWWLSPELYLRRPPAANEKWRLDHLLQRKAKEGVKIFVIVYKEVSNDFTPVESNYTKTRLLGLHRNIHVQRSPSHGLTPQFWSHHEKMCVIDQTIAFMGGLDLCFGRWDTPGHVLIDDGPTGMGMAREEIPDDVQIWTGKDYSNGRVSDFFTLSKPEEDMYDRNKVPRQPWHDIGLQLVGQPARDLCRHFVQRWNYLLRTKNHTRLMPFLLPPADFTPLELAQKRIFGTCEAQICRSASPWSIGTPNKVEHSIQTAYIKAIQLSDHFVYIENQFFISSTLVEGVVIENKIGDALVSRIIRAHHEGTAWRAIIVIPLEPGYPASLDSAEAGSVRLILECQNRTICRGQHSIFGRLRKEGIDPDEYITFFGLRGWGKLKNGCLTSEAIYIHAKCMVVDDRVAIIGSANINERSQRGDRDSELACVIRDTDMMESTMGGRPYQVGRFAHSLRVRLMREHLGIDTDEMEARELGLDVRSRDSIKSSQAHSTHSAPWDPDREQQQGMHETQKHGHVKGQAEQAKHTARHVAHEIANVAAIESDRAAQEFADGSR
ncbi:phospholipase D/nuclease, partial [Atractiella rhizophila]